MPTHCRRDDQQHNCCSYDSAAIKAERPKLVPRTTPLSTKRGAERRYSGQPKIMCKGWRHFKFSTMPLWRSWTHCYEPGSSQHDFHHDCKPPIAVIANCPPKRLRTTTNANIWSPAWFYCAATNNTTYVDIFFFLTRAILTLCHTAASIYYHA